MQEVPLFERSVDELFEDNSPSYSLVGDRRAGVLNTLYPKDDERCIRILVERGGRLVGWALLLDSAMTDHKYFGNMRVGTLADCFAALEDAPAVVAAADEVLTRRGVDLRRRQTSSIRPGAKLSSRPATSPGRRTSSSTRPRPLRTRCPTNRTGSEGST